MEDAVRITRPGPTKVVYDPITRKSTTVTGTQVYQGKARLWEVSAGGHQIIGDQEFRVSQTYLSIPWDAPIPEPEDRVQILLSVDPQLVGRSLLILSVTRGGGLRVSRKMSVRFTDFEKEDL